MPGAALDNVIFWQTLSLTPGIGRSILRTWQDNPALPRRLDAVAEALGPADPALARALLSPPDSIKQAIDDAIRWERATDCHLISIDDPRYPAVLASITDPPAVLHLHGRPEAFTRPVLAIVGSRHASADGLRLARSFSMALAEWGFSIVSGLAAGIDHAAHLGALEADGVSLAVVGTGVDRCYPPRHHDVAARLTERGAVMSELPLGALPLPHHFPRRNRIIAGLAAGVLVVQAAERSGSLITARLALDDGREVMAIPGSVHSPVHRGCHQLIRDGATLVERVDDVIAALERSIQPALPGLSEHPVGGSRSVTAQAHGVHGHHPRLAPSSEAERMLDQIGWSPVEIDTLFNQWPDDPGEAARLLLELELGGWIERLHHGQVQRIA